MTFAAVDPTQPALSRADKEAIWLKLCLREKAIRSAGGGGPLQRSWARSYAGRPVEFIGAVMGSEWWTDDWLPWRAVTYAAFGLQMPEAEARFYVECTGRSEPPSRRQREVYLGVGRRGGKSRWEAMVGVYLVCCEDWTAHLAPGEIGYVTVLADQRPHAHAIMSYAKAALRHPKLAPLVTRDMAETVELRGGVAFAVGTASIKAVRSHTVVAALADEIAFWPPDEESANPDFEILNALRPAMLTMPGAMVLAASSPYARKGVLWDAYQRLYQKDHATQFYWKAPTWTMHPSVPRDEIDQEYERDPIAAASEYGAEFRHDVAAFIVREVVEAAVVSGRFELPPAQGVVYHGFVDPSGGVADSMTLGIAHRAPNGDGVLDLLREARPPFSPETVSMEFANVCKHYRIKKVRGDHYGGEWPREQFAKWGVTYEPTEHSKSEIYREFLPLVNSGRVELLDVRRMVDQLCWLERRTSRGGRDTIDHPPAAHDDVSNVAAGALVLAAGKRSIASLFTDRVLASLGPPQLRLAPVDRVHPIAAPAKIYEPMV